MLVSNNFHTRCFSKYWYIKIEYFFERSRVYQNIDIFRFVGRDLFLFTVLVCKCTSITICYSLVAGLFIHLPKVTLATLVVIGRSFVRSSAGPLFPTYINLARVPADVLMWDSSHTRPWMIDWAGIPLIRSCHQCFQSRKLDFHISLTH